MVARVLTAWPPLTGVFVFFALAQVLPPFVPYLRSPLLILVGLVSMLCARLWKASLRLKDAAYVGQMMGETIDRNLWKQAKGDYGAYLALKSQSDQQT